MSTLALSVTKTWGNRALDVHDPAWKALKQIVVKRDGCQCRFCGFRATKHMILDHVDGDASNNDLVNLMLNCAACDRIRHCGLAGMHGFLTLCESNIEQKQIVIKSREFFRQHGRNPDPIEIDPNAKKTTLRVTELANKLKKTDNPEAVRGNLKGFFTEKFTNWQIQWEVVESGSLFDGGENQNPCAAYGGDGWLRAQHLGAPPVDLRYTGKWMLFLPCPVAHRGWTLVRESTANGRLGFRAKIARQDEITQPKIRNSAGPEHVVCIYTRDWRDHEDVLRIGKVLVEIGAVKLQANDAMYYKADEQTHRSISGSIYQLAPPYQRLKPTYGLTQWAQLAEEAQQVLSVLHHEP